MKKNILFIMNNLNCGGAEKALISLLQTMDYSKYNVDLLLFKQEGIFLNNIPKEVNLLKEPIGYNYFDMSIKEAILDCIKKFRFDIALNRLFAGYIFKTEKNRVVCEQRVWKYISSSIKYLNKKYDVAIGYLEKNPIYFCVEKVNAKKKIGFIHNDYEQLGMDPNIDVKYFDKLDNIVTVSESCEKVLKQKFPQYEQKIKVMYNILSTKTINKMADENVYIDNEKINIVSVGRLNYQKGFDMAIEACELLKKDGYDFTWSILGEGEERSKLEKMIKERNLEKIFILKGIQENPYPYIKQADIYVQPSRFEGKSIAIDEAKILNKPIIVTDFSTAKDQIVNEKNGLIVDMNSENIYKAIKKVIDLKELRQKLRLNLSMEKLGTEKEIEKLYKLFE